MKKNAWDISARPIENKLNTFVVSFCHSLQIGTEFIGAGSVSCTNYFGVPFVGVQIVRSGADISTY